MLRKNLLNSFKTSNSLLLEDLKTRISLTYQDAFPKIKHIIDLLEQQDIKQGDRVAVAMENSMQFVLLYIACLLQRIVICPVNPKYSSEDIQYCVDLSRAKKIITNKPIENLPISTISVNSLFPADSHHHNETLTPICDEEDYAPDDLFSITFTSGTTGKPKAIAHKAEVHLNNAAAFNKFTGNDAHQRMLHVMPMFYMAGILNTILCPLQAGGCIVIDGAFGPLSPITFWKSFLDNNCTTTWLSPTMIQSILKLDRNESYLEEIKSKAGNFRIFAGTAPLSVKTKQDFYKKYHVNLLQSYGLSETLYVSVKKFGKSDFNRSVGSALDGIKIHFAEDGEILLETDYMMAGYINSDNEFVLEDSRIFRTGDLGTIKDGELYITGRKKDLIIKGGENIDPKKIEQVVSELEFVKYAAVVGYKHEFYGEDIKLFAELMNQNLKVDKAEENILNHCKNYLPAALIPSKITFINEMPLTPTGKIRKNKLKGD